MQKRKIVEATGYKDGVLRINARISGPDPEGLVFSDDDDETDTSHTEPMFTVVENGLRHMLWPKHVPGFSIPRRINKRIFPVNKKVLKQARKTLIKSRLRSYVMSRVRHWWANFDPTPIFNTALSIATLTILILIYMKGR